MASGGSGVPSIDPTDTPSLQAGVPADSQSGKDTPKAKEGKSVSHIYYM